MFFMLRSLPILIELGLVIFCFIDCLQTPDDEVRNLPKWVWLLLILFFAIIGPIAWLFAGRPVQSPRSRAPWPATATAGFPEYERARRPALGPDDDPAFLAELRRVNDEHEQTLRRWEDDLKRREDQLRRQDPDHPAAEPPA